MATRDLTPMQAAFLDALFDEAKGDIRTAMNIAGYSKSAAVSTITHALKDEILDRAKTIMAGAAPKAALAMIGLVDDPCQIGSQVKLAAAEKVLDRVGIVKQDKVEISGGEKIGIFLLPPKQED